SDHDGLLKGVRGRPGRAVNCAYTANDALAALLLSADAYRVRMTRSVGRAGFTAGATASLTGATK
ncbi:MAG: hypothetical protein MUC68_16945, partial [Burkholderiaceae bacterium]|nr:hypothetical protein [Burkholderiaceae bacterium]